MAGASGWLLAYLQFNESAVGFVTSMSQNPTVVLLIVAAVMIVVVCHLPAPHFRPSSSSSTFAVSSFSW